MIEDNDRDLYFTEDGDFFLERKSKKLFLAGKKDNQLLYSLIKRRLQSNEKDWRLNSPISSNLNVFKGMPRTAETIDAIKRFLYATLMEDFLVEIDNLYIVNLGVRENIVAFGISIDRNEPSADDRLSFNLLYDFRENRFTTLDLLGVFSWWHV